MLEGLDGLDGIIGGQPQDDDFDYMPTFEDLTPFEVDHFVDDLEEHQLEDVGSSRWLSQHERMEKLNWTAHSQAKEGFDEYVVDQFNTSEKVPLLVYDLMLIEVWKEKIWPLVKSKIAKFSSLRTYIPVYHEATLTNLLEVCLFHRTTCEEAQDALVDLVDYCIRKLRYLLHTPNEELVHQVSAKECAEWDSVMALNQQFNECEFQICMCVISILRFLTDHRVALPLAVTTRLLDTHDVLQLLVPLMEKAPWVRTNRVTGRIEKFEEHKWQVVEADDEGRLPKLHSQVWLTIYNLIMDQECRSRYELTSFRKENLLRLRRYINEVVVDQIPPLTNLHRTLEELSISGRFTGADSGAPANSPFVVELVAEARERLVRTYEGRWQEVADHQLKEVLVKETPEELKRLGSMISIPKELFEEGPDPIDITGLESAGGAVSSERDAWEAVLGDASVRSTASFFAAAREEGPLDEVFVLSAPSQATPYPGDRLKLELRRSRQSLLKGSSGQGRAALDAKLAARRKDDGGETFTLTVDAPGIDLSVLRPAPFVSAKGAAKTAQQLRDLLRKPGRESLLAMYSEDVAEFSVPVVARNSNDEGLDFGKISGLVFP